MAPESFDAGDPYEAEAYQGTARPRLSPKEKARRGLLIFLAIPCLLLLYLLMPRNRPPAARRQAVTIPLFLGRRGHPLVRVGLPASRSATLLVDSGSSISMLRSDLAESLNLPVLAGHLPNGASLLRWNPGLSAAVIVPRVDLGGLRLDAVQMVLVEPGQMPAAGQDGILGLDVLGESAAAFDFEHRLLSLCFPGGLNAADLRRAGFDGGACVALRSADGAAFYAPVTLDGASRELRVDTGSDSTLIPAAWARELGLRPVAHDTQVGFSGAHRVAVARCPTLTLGPATARNVSVLYPVDGTTLEPTLGLDALSRLRFLIDFPGKRLYLQRPSSSWRSGRPARS